MNVLTSPHTLIVSMMRRLYARSMQPWSVILMRVMRSRRRFIICDALRRHRLSWRCLRIEPT